MVNFLTLNAFDLLYYLRDHVQRFCW